MDDDQQFCLRWNNHQSTLISVFDTLLENETLVDCTLAAEGKFLKAHKVVLSACSPYFATLLQEQYDKHPIFILKDVKYQELRAMMDYMYRGEVNISQDQLAALLKAAESLQIKGLSDNRSGGAATAPKPDHHRVTMPTAKLSSGYTLEQTKRARIAGPAEREIGSREGSSSPSRRRRKVRRRSIENAMTDVHDNSNSSQQLQTQSNASGLGAITAAASALAAAAAAAPNQQSLAANVPLSASTSSSTAVTATGTTLSSSKKTDNVKGITQQQTQQHDAMNTENAQGPASATTATGLIDTETTDAAVAATTAAEKSNHKQMQQQKQIKDSINASGATSSDLVIEPKAEYDDEANDEPVEDLTLDEEDMGMDDLDQNAGTSQGGEGSSQGYAPWQHDRSQDELLLATQEAQQRDPQDDTTPLRSSSFLYRGRQSIRLKTSPQTSPLPTTPTGPGVIKYEPSTILDENDDDDDDEDENKLVVSGLEHNMENNPSSAGGAGMSRSLEEEDEDEEESEQPCDLRLSSHFKLNLGLMALQQAAVVAATGDQKTAAAMAAAMMSSSGAAAGSSGMPPTTQLQQAALQTIAAVATSHQTPHHALHHQAQQHAAAAAHHALMNYPTGAASPSRRFSTSSCGAGGSGNPGSSGTAGLLSGSGSSGSCMLQSTSSTAIVGASTSTIVAPHTPSSTIGGSSGGMLVGGQGVVGAGSAGAPGVSGSGGSGGSSTSWGGAYTCDRCGNSYARPHSLNRHVRFECGVEPKFECPICHKKSKHKHNLVLHMRTHQHR